MKQKIMDFLLDDRIYDLYLAFSMGILSWALLLASGVIK